MSDDPIDVCDFVPVGHKYSALFFSDLHRDYLSDRAFDLGENAKLIFGATIALPDHWTTWLGTEAKQIDGRGAAIVVWRPSTRLDVLDAENVDLDKETVNWAVALSLFATPGRFNQMIGLSGSRTVEETSVRSAGRWQGRGVWGVVPERFVPERLPLIRLAKAAAVDLFAGQAARLARGLGSYWTAMAAPTGEDRLFGFVRAVEGVVAYGAWPKRELFRDRAREWAEVAEVGTVLSEFYSLRNAIAHLLEFEKQVQVPSASTAQRQFAYRHVQAERLARGLYARLLTNAALRAHFTSEEAAKAYWAADLWARGAAFGAKISLDLSEEDLRWIDAALRD